MDSPQADDVALIPGEAATLDLSEDAEPGSPSPYDNPFDDVFEDLSTPLDGEVDQEGQYAEPLHASDRSDRHAAHPSDIPRLQAEHMTAGYREGISAGKEKTVQQGFDEGFSLGATIGLAAGRLIGTLEGIEKAMGDDQSGRTKNMLEAAREELSGGRLFSAEYWAPDGGWTYDVKQQQQQPEQQPVVDDHTSGDEDVTFADVASSHPLIMKWALAVAEEAENWNVEANPALDDDDVSSLFPNEGLSSSSSKTPTTTASQGSLDW